MWRRTKRRFGIAAPKLSVRPHVAWYWRWSMLLPFVLVTVAAAWFAFDHGLEFAGFYRGQSQQELTQLREQNSRLLADNLRLSEQVAQYERQVLVEHSRGEENAKLIDALNDELSGLQVDMAFFQNLTEAQRKEGGVAVRRLELQRDPVPGEYRVQMLLVQGGQRVEEFVGGYQLVATVSQNGRTQTLVFPEGKEKDGQFDVNFRYYRRVRQNIRIGPDAKLENVQVRLFKQGESTPKVRQNVTVS